MIEIIFNSPFSANTTKYTCDFEKAMHCGISQITDDRGEFLMMNGSYLREKILYEEAFNEHTNNDSDGTSYKQLTHIIKICLFWFSFQKCFALYFLLTCMHVYCTRLNVLLSYFCNMHVYMYIVQDYLNDWKMTIKVFNITQLIRHY